MSFDLERALQEWAEENLESIGVSRDKAPNFDELRQKVVNGLRQTYSNEALKIYFNRSENMRTLQNPDGFARVTGPCGDTMEVYLKLRDGNVAEASFQTDGCIPSMMAGGMATRLASGKSLEEARTIEQETVLEALGGLPEDHVHCALLASDTLKEAIKNALSR
ncbi:MAG: iron-sulfur cluster assembly scaffold protein [Dehalococcoidia bacterium]